MKSGVLKIKLIISLAKCGHGGTGRRARIRI